MKRLLFFFLLCGATIFGGQTALAYSNANMSPYAFTSNTDTVTITNTSGINLCIWYPNNTFDVDLGTSGSVSTFLLTFGSGVVGTYHIVSVNTAYAGPCSGLGNWNAGFSSQGGLGTDMTSNGGTADGSFTFGSPPFTSTGGFGPGASEIFGQSNTASTTYSYTVVDNPTQDYFDGILVFMFSMTFMVWFFRKK